MHDCFLFIVSLHDELSSLYILKNRYIDIPTAYYAFPCGAGGTSLLCREEFKDNESRIL
jgi:hypothetical protein